MYHDDLPSAWLPQVHSKGTCFMKSLVDYHTWSDIFSAWLVTHCDAHLWGYKVGNHTKSESEWNSFFYLPNWLGGKTIPTFLILCAMEWPVTMCYQVLRQKYLNKARGRLSPCFLKPEFMHVCVILQNQHRIKSCMWTLTSSGVKPYYLEALECSTFLKEDTTLETTLCKEYFHFC